MTLLAATNLTLLDLAKRLKPTDEGMAIIIEMMSQMNPLMSFIPFKEGNLPTGERTSIRTGLPAVFFRMINQGVPSSKSTTAQIDEGCAMLQAWSNVDIDLAKISGDIAGLRLSESAAFLEAMLQTAMYTWFYGNSAINPKEFTGLSNRYNDLNAANGENIIDAGGTGSDNASIWLLGLGDKSLRGIYPKGTTAGVERKDMKEQVVYRTEDGEQTQWHVLQEKFDWKLGLTLKDWRQTVRIANIDISNLVDDNAAADLIKLMIKATHHIGNLGDAGIKFCFAMNRSLFQYLDLQRYETVKQGGGITWGEIDGKRIPYFRSIPIYVTDALLNSEERVIGL